MLSNGTLTIMKVTISEIKVTVDAHSIDNLAALEVRAKMIL